MTGETHRVGGMLCSIVGFELLHRHDLLIPNVNVVLQWLVMYPFCIWGSVASDLDHSWARCPDKGYPSRVINLLLHITKPIIVRMDRYIAKHKVERRSKVFRFIYRLNKFFCASHRSWQTHSDLTVIGMLYLLYCVMTGRFMSIGAVDLVLCNLVLMGVCLGVISHFILDMLTPDGIWLMGAVIVNKACKRMRCRIRLPETFHFVPRGKRFATGTYWEDSVRRFLRFCIKVALAGVVLFYLLPYVMELMPFQIVYE